MAKDDRKFPAVSAALAYRDVACGYLRDKWSPLRNAPKLLARIANATPRAAINWFAHESAPNGETLITLMANDPEFEQIIIDLVRRRRCVHGPILSNSENADGDVPAD